MHSCLSVILPHFCQVSSFSQKSFCVLKGSRKFEVLLYINIASGNLPRHNFITYFQCNMSLCICNDLSRVMRTKETTRMHSSKMRTICFSGRWGGCLPQCMLGYAWPGASAPVHAGICLPRGVSGPVHAGIHTAPTVNRMTDRQV